MKQAIKINVNGVDHTAEVEPRMLLVHYLRDVLALTGTHVGCETSICGACTLLVDGQAVKSCTMAGRLTPCHHLGSRRTATAPMQEGFYKKTRTAMRSYCTPGMIMASQVIIETLIHLATKSVMVWKAISAAAPAISTLWKRLSMLRRKPPDFDLWTLVFD
jgi:carbon-monoxide dehydrogenase small subunit